MKQIIQILDSRKIKIFSYEESLDAARELAASLLIDSPKSNISSALDIYHNTLIEQLKQDVIKELPHGN